MATLEQQLTALPQKPGVYIFKSAKGNILYVGKAKRLTNRVQSYFRPQAVLDPAKQQMVKKVAAIETIATDTENEALVLEASLIRQHQPPYNVVLRDDKYYLFIKITTSEEFPRVFPVRRVKRDGARYFGPYSSAQSVRATLRLLRRLFPYKGEKDSPHDVVFPHPLFSKRSKLSHTHSDALGARVGRQNFVGLEASDKTGPAESYAENIQNIIRFLSGQREEIMEVLRAGMEQAAEDEHFERATTFRDQLQSIERLEGTQKVFLTTKESFDVVSLALAGQTGLPAGRSAANVFQIRQGKLLGKQTFLLQHRAEARAADTLRQFILQYYGVAQDIPKVIFIPENLSDQTALAAWINQVSPPVFTIPRRGKKRQLLAMGEMNAHHLLRQEEVNFQSDARLKKAQAELFEAIGLPRTPRGAGRVETYDISNIQGQLATASMVVFENGQPQRQQYRKFKIKISGEPNDFAMLQETLCRRFSGRHEDWKMPDLIMIDGGKGQLSSAVKILGELKVDVPAIALAKREEEIFKTDQKNPMRLPYNSDALYLLQRMRDEAHRFTITYHRLLRSKRSTRSLLDDIPGIGPKAKRQLLQHFGSIKNIRAAPHKALEAILGPKRTKSLENYL